MQSIVNAIVGNLSSSRFKNLPESEKEKIIKAMSTEKVSSTVGDEIFDYYFTNNKDSVSNCMKKHIYNEGEDCYEPRMNNMFETVPNFVMDPNKKFLKNITFGDYIKNVDEYDKAFKSFIPSKIKEYFFKSGKLNLPLQNNMFKAFMFYPGQLTKYIKKIKIHDQDEEKKKQELQQFRNNVGSSAMTEHIVIKKKLDESVYGISMAILMCRMGISNLEGIYNELSDFLKRVGMEDFSTFKIFVYYIAVTSYKYSLKNSFGLSQENIQDKTDEKHKEDTKKAREEAIELFRLVVNDPN